MTITDEDEGHVTVRIGTDEGTISMPWLPRTADLMSVAVAWTDRSGRRLSVIEDRG